MGDKLFPEFLNKGSEGPAVAVLQLILRIAYTDVGSELEVDGVYGEKTAEAVKTLQEELGVDADGDFGPATRQVLKEQWSMDVNALPASMFQGETRAVVPERVGG